VRTTSDASWLNESQQIVISDASWLDGSLERIITNVHIRDATKVTCFSCVTKDCLDALLMYFSGIVTEDGSQSCLDILVGG
jgi:hypothetical protein